MHRDSGRGRENASDPCAGLFCYSGLLGRIAVSGFQAAATAVVPSPHRSIQSNRDESAAVNILARAVACSPSLRQLSLHAARPGEQERAPGDEIVRHRDFNDRQEFEERDVGERVAVADEVVVAGQLRREDAEMTTDVRRRLRDCGVVPAGRRTRRGLGIRLGGLAVGEVSRGRLCADRRCYERSALLQASRSMTSR